MARPSATDGVEQNRPRLMPETANLRLLRGNGQIAHGHQLAACGRGDAMNPCDHRLRHFDQGHHHPAALLEQLLHIGLAVVGTHLLEVVAGTEGLAGAGNDHHAHRCILGDGIERRLQFGQQFLRQGIKLPGPIQGQPGDALAVFAQQHGQRGLVGCVHD
jgi:hypothetical protein